jgi:putative oxidoreductase
MRLFETASPRQINVALAILRVVTGIIFTAHGAQKVFVYGFDGVAGGFAQMGIPMAAFAAPAVALVELLGGLALIAGLLTRVASLGLGITMLGAFFFAHMKAGFFLPNGYEFVLTLFAIVTTLMITGAGAFSLDAVLAGRRLATQRVGGVLRAS